MPNHGLCHESNIRETWPNLQPKWAQARDPARAAVHDRQPVVSERRAGKVLADAQVLFRLKCVCRMKTTKADPGGVGLVKEPVWETRAVQFYAWRAANRRRNGRMMPAAKVPSSTTDAGSGTAGSGTQLTVQPPFRTDHSSKPSVSA